MGAFYHKNASSILLSDEARVGVIFAGAVVPGLIGKLMRGKLFQQGLVIVVEAAFVEIDQIYTKIVCVLVSRDF